MENRDDTGNRYPRLAGPVASAPREGTKLRGSMNRGGRSDDTFDSGMGTLKSHGIGPAMESLLPDTLVDRGNDGVSASTPILRASNRARMRHFGRFWTPIPDALLTLSPTLRTQQGLRFADPSLVAGPLAILVQLSIAGENGGLRVKMLESCPTGRGGPVCIRDGTRNTGD